MERVKSGINVEAWVEPFHKAVAAFPERPGGERYEDRRDRGVNALEAIKQAYRQLDASLGEPAAIDVLARFLELNLPLTPEKEIKYTVTITPTEICRETTNR